MPHPQSPAKLHFREQEAAVLLDPVRIELRELHARLDHYLERLILSDGDKDRLAQARQAIEEAASRISALQGEADLR